jgi:hypothetical protein
MSSFDSPRAGELAVLLAWVELTAIRLRRLPRPRERNF